MFQLEMLFALSKVQLVTYIINILNPTININNI